MADNALIAQVRERFVKKYNGNILDDTFDERDVAWVKSSDQLVRNVLKAFKVSGNVEKAVDLLNDMLTFRAKMKLNDFKETDIHPELRQLNGVLFHGVDKDGRPVLHFQVAKQKKGHLVEESKQSIAFHINKYYMASLDKPCIAIFDFTGAGLGNMDLDISRFIITSFATYFPGVSARNLMFKMHKALEAVWMVIKQWMDAEQSRNTVFVSRKDIQTYINKDQLLPHMIKEDKPDKK